MFQGEPFVTWRQRDINEDDKKAAHIEIEAEDDEEREYGKKKRIFYFILAVCVWLDN